MWVCVHGDLGMWQWLGGPEGFSELEDWTQLQRVSFPCGDERCSDWCLGKPPFAGIGIQAMPGNQPKGSDEGLTDCPVPSSVSGDIRPLF